MGKGNCNRCGGDGYHLLGDSCSHCYGTGYCNDMSCDCNRAAVEAAADRLNREAARKQPKTRGPSSTSLASSSVDAGGDFLFGIIIVAGCLIAGLVFLLAVYGARTALYAGPVFAVALIALVLVNVFGTFAIPGWLTLRGPVAAGLYILTFFGAIAAFQAWTNDVSNQGFGMDTLITASILIIGVVIAIPAARSSRGAVGRPARPPSSGTAER